GARALGEVVKKYPTTERHNPRTLPAAGRGAGLRAGAGGARRGAWRKVAITSGRPRTERAQTPIGKPSSHAGDHGSTARRAATTQSRYERPRSMRQAPAAIKAIQAGPNRPVTANPKATVAASFTLSILST